MFLSHREHCSLDRLEIHPSMCVPFLSYPTHPLQVSLALLQTEKCPLKLHKEVISKKEKILFQNDSVTSLQGDEIALLDHCEASRAFLSNFFH